MSETKNANRACAASNGVGVKRVRKDRWTPQLDEEIARSYLSHTNLDTRKVSEIRKLIYADFKSKFPDCKFNIQDVGSRYINIIKHNKYILPSDMDRIREQVRAQSEWNAMPSEEVYQPTDEPQPEPENEVSEGVDPAGKKFYTELEEEYKRSLGEEFEVLLVTLQGSDPVNRPQLKKIKPTRPLQIAVKVMNNSVIPKYLSEETTFDELIKLTYCAAAVCEAKLDKNKNRNNARDNRENAPKRQAPRSKNIPRHILRLRNRIAQLRKDASRICQFISGTKSARLAKLVKEICNRFPINAGHGDVNDNCMEVADTIKQTLSKLNYRLQRYETSAKRREQNAQFKNNEKIFYRNLNANDTDQLADRPAPTKEDLQTFWGGIWSEPAEHNKGAEWIQKEREKFANKEKMGWESITPEEVTRVISRAHNWKSPGIDNIHNFWLKSLKHTHKYFAKFFNDFINDPECMPEYLTRGRTFMLPKDNDTKNPAKYRPITCLNTTYKLLTGILTDRLYAHLTRNGILAEEQKGCRRGSKGCKEQVLLDSVIVGSNRRLNTAYIDYKKAFDSVPHSWILEALDIYGVAQQLSGFLERAMDRWETMLVLRLGGPESVITDTIRIRRGIYQGDSLSPLLFCVAMNPLSSVLNRSVAGVKVCGSWVESSRITHLLYMDDIKLYARNAEDLETLLRSTQTYSKDISMEFGIDKCRTAVTGSAVRGAEASAFTCESGDIILGMEEEETYKYLGFLQSRKLEHKQIKDRLTKQFFSRSLKIIKTKLNGKNMVKAINTYAIPVLSYSFGVIKWTKEELRRLRTRLSKILNKYCMHHPNSAVERLTLSRKLGGRGFIDITHLHNSQVDKLRKFFADRAEVSPLHASAIKGDNHHTPLNLLNTAKHAIPLKKTDAIKSKLETLDAKALHGRHQKVLAGKYVDKEASNAWLARAGLFPETEGFMLAIQDEVIATKNYRKHIIKDRSVLNDMCRLCHKETENIQHVTSGCEKMAGKEYLHRHNQIAKIIHQRLAKKHNLLKETVPYYNYNPQPVIRSDELTLYWDRSMHTDKKVGSNRPDITLIDKREKIAYLIDVAVPNSHNIKKKVEKKLEIYANLAFEIKKQNKLKKVEVIPIIISATGVIPKCLKGYLTRIGLPWGLFVELQKAAVLGTCRAVRRFMERPEEYCWGV